MRLARLAPFAALLLGCATPGDGPRPFVITDGGQVKDLFWRGELTDSRGNRWNVKLLPGIAPSIEAAGEGWRDGLDFAHDPLEAGFWDDRADEVRSGAELAVKTTLREFLLEGIGEDLKGGAEGAASNVRETPFAWIPRALGHLAWGCVIKPVGRLALAPVGVAGGLGWATLLPVGQVLSRPVAGLGWCALAGTAAPTARIAIQPPAFLLALMNREPAQRHDGRFGLSIIERADGLPLLGEEEVRPEPPQPVVAPSWDELLATEREALLGAVEREERARLEEAQAARRGLHPGRTDDREAWEAWRAQVDPQRLAGDGGSWEAVLERARSLGAEPR